MEHELSNEGGAAKLEEELVRNINASIDLAARQGRWIDDLTAKRIARAIEPGSGALREFVDTGAILPDMEAELEAVSQALPEAQLWTAELGLYCLHRRRKEAMSYWNEAGME
jgi:hypothetical protein